MLKKIFTLMFATLILSSFTNYANSQEENEPEFETGFVLEVSNEMIKIVDNSEEEEKKFEFKVNDNTVFENFDEIAEVVVGDELYIEYAMEGGKMTALSVFKMELEEDDEDMESSSDMQDSEDFLNDINGDMEEDEDLDLDLEEVDQVK